MTVPLSASVQPGEKKEPLGSFFYEGALARYANQVTLPVPMSCMAETIFTLPSLTIFAITSLFFHDHF